MYVRFAFVAPFYSSSCLVSDPCFGIDTMDLSTDLFSLDASVLRQYPKMSSMERSMSSSLAELWGCPAVGFQVLWCLDPQEVLLLRRVCWMTRWLCPCAATAVCRRYILEWFYDVVSNPVFVRLHRLTLPEEDEGGE